MRSSIKISKNLEKYLINKEKTYQMNTKPMIQKEKSQQNQQKIIMVTLKKERLSLFMEVTSEF